MKLKAKRLTRPKRYDAGLDRDLLVARMDKGDTIELNLDDFEVVDAEDNYKIVAWATGEEECPYPCCQDKPKKIEKPTMMYEIEPKPQTMVFPKEFCSWVSEVTEAINQLQEK